MAKTRYRNDVRLVGVIRRTRATLMLSTALQAAAMLVLSPPADAQPPLNAHPTGGSVVAGSAAITSTSSNNTQIDQSTQRAAIDWKSFDVGSQQQVTFSQPSASAVTLNRVTGPDPSQIAGRIAANGQIILVNQSGVNFYHGAQVNAAGVMVSTIGASDQSVKSFVASTRGWLALDQPGNPNAKVDNQGNITIKQAGLAALVAPQVANSGTITARLGHVVLAGAKTATLDLYGDGLLSLDVTNQVAQTPVDKNNNSVTALVTNTGVIIADGGTVQLTARAADGIVQNLVQAGGTIRAATVGGQTGTVALNGVGGSIVVEGQLSTPGNAPGTIGGAIVTNATGNVTLTPTAMLNASGQAGGGTVAVGTTLARAVGGPGVTPTLTAANVVVQKGATIAADATSKGKGGRVTVLSANATAMAGSISAKGGSQGGDGGFIETSGLGVLTIGPDALVSAAAPKGQPGAWLLDPDSNVTITTATMNVSCGGSPAVCLPSADSSTLAANTIIAALNAGTSVTVQTTNPAGIQAGNILVGLGPLDGKISGFNAPSAVTLTLNAGSGGGAGDVTVNSPISDSGSTGALSVVFTAGGGITLNNGVTIGGSLSATAGPAGAIQVNAGGAISAAGGLTLAAGTGGISLADNLTASGQTVTLTSAGMINQSAGVITAGTLSGSAAISASLTQPLNQVGTLGAFSTAAGFVLTDEQSLLVNGPVKDTGAASAGVDLTASSIVVSGPITATSSLGLAATNGAITEGPGGSIVTPLLSASTAGTGGDLSLTSTTNMITTSDGVSATNGNVVLVNGQDLTLAGLYSGNNMFFEVATKGGTLTLGTLTRGESEFGDLLNPATLTAAANGRISLVADNHIVLPPTPDSTPSSIIVPNGTLELAPYGPSNATTSTSQLINSGLLPITNVGTTELNALVIGGFTDVPNGATSPTPSSKNITIDKAFDLTNVATTLDLEVTGGVSQSAPITNVGTLLGTTGSLDLSTIPNMVNTLGNITAAGGDLTLADSVALGVSGVVSAAHNVFLTTSNAVGITIAAAGDISAGMLASFRADAFTNLGKVTGVTFELAPATIGITQAVVALGSVPNNVRLGAVTLPGTGSPTITAGSIVVGSNFGTAAMSLELDSLGGISETGGAVTAASLVGQAGTTVSLTNANAIARVGSFSLGAGAFTLNDAGLASNLTVDGPLNATTVTIQNAPTISIPGKIDASAAVVVISGDGGIYVLKAGLVTGPIIDLNGSSGGIILADNARVGSDGGIVDFTTTGNGVRETAGAIVTAGTLQSSGGVSGPFDLSLGGNDIANLGGITVTGGTFSLNDTGHIGTLDVGGPVTASDISIVSGFGALTVTGSIGAMGGVLLDGSNETAGIALNGGALVTGTALQLSGGPIGIALNGNASLGQTGALIDLIGGQVTETPSAVVTGAKLESTGGVSGNVDLFGTANAVGAIDNFSVIGGNNHFALHDSLGLTVTGMVTAPSQVYLETTSNAVGITIVAAGNVSAGMLASFQADAFTNLGKVTGVTFELAPATIGITQAVVALGSVPNNVRLGAVTLPGTGSPTITAGSIVVGSNFGTAAMSLELDSLGGISETGGAVTAASLVGQAGTTVSLTNANAIARVGSFSLGAGAFTLNDAGLASNLTVDGPLNATTVTIQNAPTISIPGKIDASARVVVTSGDGGIYVLKAGLVTGPIIDLNGSSGGIILADNARVGSDGGIVDFTTTSNGVSETAGAIVTAGTLQSSEGITGNVVMAGANNAIATLGPLAVSGGTFSLTDTGNLNVAGKLTASDITIGDAGTLTVSNSLIATSAANLTAASVAIPGLINGESVALTGTAGSVNETGTLSAGTLSGSATGAVSLSGGANQVATLGNFHASSFTLNDSTDLLLEGTLNAARTAILAPTNRISLGDGATIITGGTVRPPGPIQPALEPANGGPGALLQAASFAQIGGSTVVGQDGGPATLQISTTGNAQFNPPLGLAATGTWLILNLTNGTAAGNVFVNALDVIYTVPGSINLFGAIAGVTGGPAASLGFILPAINTNYLFNNCEIGAAACRPQSIPPPIPIPPTRTTVSLNIGLTATLGAIYPLLAITPPSLTNLPNLVLIALPMLQSPPPQLTNPDVVPPNITYLDY